MEAERHHQVEVVHQLDACAVMHLAGEIDLGARDHVVGVARSIVRERGAVLVLDLSEVTFFDASGVSCLVAITEATEAHGATLQVRNPSPCVVRVLQIVGAEFLSAEG